jgi:hypothetical protein
MAIQTSYENSLTRVWAGMMLDPFLAKIQSRAFESAAGVDAGRVVTKGASADGKGAKLIADEADLANVIGGVRLKSIKEPNPVSGSSNRFAQYDLIEVVSWGELYMEAVGTIGSDVEDIYVVNTNASGHLGKVSAAAGSGGTAATLVPGLRCRFGTAVSGTGVCLIQFALGPKGPKGDQGEPGV